MRYILLNLLILLCQFEMYGQIIKGEIIDSKSHEPLEYVSIGIINTPYGTVTDDKGCFEFVAKAEDLSSTVRISKRLLKSRKLQSNRLQKERLA